MRGPCDTAALLAAWWEQLCVFGRALALQSSSRRGALTGEERIWQSPEKELIWCKIWQQVFDSRVWSHVCDLSKVRYELPSFSAPWILAGVLI